MEKEPKIENIGVNLNPQEIEDFIKSRNIKTEDLFLIKTLTSFSQEMIVMELHNLFNVHHERSGEQLEILMRHSQDAHRKKLYRTIQKFYQKYGWKISFSLVRLLEGEV